MDLDDVIIYDDWVKYGDPIPLMISWDTHVVSIGVFPVPMVTPDVDEGFGLIHIQIIYVVLITSCGILIYWEEVWLILFYNNITTH